MQKVLLYSGGMDSWLIDKLWKPDIKLFFNIGTPNNIRELDRVKKCPHIKIVDLPLFEFEQIDNNYYLPLRNLHFVTYAAHYGDIICLGATGSSTHKDKNETFAVLAENSINYLLSEDTTRNRPVKIVMPYKDMTKTQILAEYIKQGGDIDLCYKETFSCYNPDDEGNPCMRCTSCLSKFVAFYNNGYQFSEEAIQKFIHNALANSDSKNECVDLAIKLKYGNMTMCIDFDNTITQTSGYPITGDIRPGVKDILDEYKERGYRLVLFTSRDGIDFENAVGLCKHWNLPFDDYISGKPYARYYIDDKSIDSLERRV